MTKEDFARDVATMVARIMGMEAPYPSILCCACIDAACKIAIDKGEAHFVAGVLQHAAESMVKPGIRQFSILAAGGDAS